MKKLISVLAASALIGSIAAKPAPKKPVAPAKPAKPAVAAPAVPTAPVAAPAKSEGGLVINVGVYGGYNIPSSDLFNNVSSGSTWTKGGIVGGGSLLIGTQFIRGGVSASYLTVGKFEQGSSNATFAYLPIEGVLRVYPFGGLYIGGFGGYALDLSTASVTGSSYTKTNGVSYGGGLGYLIELGAVGIDIGADVRVLSVASTKPSANSEFTLSNLDNSGSSSKTYNFINIIPRLGVTFKF